MCRVLSRHVSSGALKGTTVEFVARFLNPATGVAWGSGRVLLKHASDSTGSTSEDVIRGLIVRTLRHVVETAVQKELAVAATKCTELARRVRVFTAQDGTERLFATDAMLRSKDVIGVSTLLGGAAEIVVYSDGKEVFRLPKGLDAPPLPYMDLGDEEWKADFEALKHIRADVERGQLQELRAIRKSVLGTMAKTSSSASLPSELVRASPEFIFSPRVLHLHFDEVRFEEMCCWLGQSVGD
jgi:hypothetical protein